MMQAYNLCTLQFPRDYMEKVALSRPYITSKSQVVANTCIKREEEGRDINRVLIKPFALLTAQICEAALQHG